MDVSVEQLWRTYHGGLRGFILSRVDDESLADDILQDVFVRIQSGLGGLRQGNRISGWIYRITRNAIIDHYRSRREFVELPEDLAAPREETGNRLKRDFAECIAPLIQSLPEGTRQAVELSEIEGLTQKQVAQRQGISLSGAKSRIQRGRAMIKDMLTACCRIEFDHRGTAIDYQPRRPGCDPCR